jgi:hypothetical protein
MDLHLLAAEGLQRVLYQIRFLVDCVLPWSGLRV